MFLCSNLYPVLLQNGLDVPYEKVHNVRDIINSLYINHSWFELSWIKKAVNSNLVIIPDERVTMFNRNPQDIMKNILQSGICDKSGRIDSDTASIIRLSVGITYKGALHLFVYIHNPISWKNYFSLSYWKEVYNFRNKNKVIK